MDKEKADYIKLIVAEQLQTLSKRNVPNEAAQKVLMETLEEDLLGKGSIDENFIDFVENPQYQYVTQLVERLLLKQFAPYEGIDKIMIDIDDNIVKLLFTEKRLEEGATKAGIAKRYMVSYFDNYHNIDIDKFVGFLHSKGISDHEIIDTYARYSQQLCISTSYWVNPKASIRDGENYELNPFGKYVLPLLQPQRGFLGRRKDNGYFKLMQQIIGKRSRPNDQFNWMVFQVLYCPDNIGDNIGRFLISKNHNNVSYVNLQAVYFLLAHDAHRYENVIVQTINSGGILEEQKIQILLFLNQKIPGKYLGQLQALGDSYMRSGIYEAEKSRVYYGRTNKNQPISIRYINFLLELNKEEGETYLARFISEAKFVNSYNITHLEEVLGERALPLLIDLLYKRPVSHYHIDLYFTTLFASLNNYKIQEFLEPTIEFAVKHANKHARLLACSLLSKQQPEIIGHAAQLVTENTVGQRIVGALILSEIDDPMAAEALDNAVDQEKNDDTRDVMLEALSSKRFSKDYTLKEVEEIVTLATKRKKLAKWGEKWLNEENLPKVYWKETGKEVNNETIRFLFYRMKRAKGINSDIEAKQVIRLIDKDKSEKFAKYLLQAFQESNFDTKSKYYLTLAGFLGNDNITNSLNTMFRKAIADKRVKMAEYILGAIVMIGSDKALRSVETVYRKMANKKPNLSQAAKEALDAAAKELNLTTDELSDRLIPNFGFEGQYKTFEVEGEEYRAFVNTEFKLNYLNEENKVRKSPPTKASKELKTEFKEMQKEVNDVVKSQHARLEKYLVEERRWTEDEWQTFFFQNPIMFVYALKLLWGEFNGEGHLVNSFYCSEDASLYDLEDEEVELSEGNYVGILHPVYLEGRQLKSWKDKLYELEMVTIFPIVEREIFKIKEEEAELNFTKQFFNEDVPKGADFVGTFLVRKNWVKSAGDGGSAEFTRLYKDGKYKAYANIEGPAVYFLGGETKATVHEISFMGKTWKDKVKLQELPPVFYSEVLSDVNELLKTT